MDGYIEIIKRVCFGKQLKTKALGRPRIGDYMKIVLILLAIINLSLVSAQQNHIYLNKDTHDKLRETDISGEIYGWLYRDNSPYIISDTLIIPANRTLEIEPGTQILFNPGRLIVIVEGRIIAHGNEDQPIEFGPVTPGEEWNGIHIFESDSTSSFRHCIFEEAWNFITVNNNCTLIEDCTFTYGGYDYIWSYGAVTFSNARGDINNCTFAYSEGSMGNAIYVTDSSKVAVSRSLIYGGHIPHSGVGSILSKFGSELYLVNTTVVKNINVSYDGYGTSLTAYGGNIYAVNSIFYFNGNDNFSIYHNGEIHLNFCNIDTFETNNSNIYANNIVAEDPQFVDFDTDAYQLMEQSPCIDSGTPFFVLNGDTLIDLNTNEYDGAAPDIGAIEFNIVSTEETTSIPGSLSLITNYPNPFNAQTTIHYELLYRTDLVFGIYDLSGKQVWIKDFEQRAPGQHSIQWKGTNMSGKGVESGVYIVQLLTPTSSVSRKIALLK